MRWCEFRQNTINDQGVKEMQSQWQHRSMSEQAIKQTDRAIKRKGRLNKERMS